jgi:hypothetical protein
VTIPGLSPALVLALLLAAIATQVAYMVRPGRPSYRWRLATGTGAILLAEVLGSLFFGRRLSFGDLHPLLDLLFLAVGQWLLIALASRSAMRDARPSFKAELRRGM